MRFPALEEIHINDVNVSQIVLTQAIIAEINKLIRRDELKNSPR